MKRNTAIQFVDDVCTIKPPLSTKSGTSLPFIAFYMNLLKVRAAAVVNEKNQCIGFITELDVTDFVFDETKNGIEPCVKDIMRLPNMSVYLDDPVEQALLMMNLHNIDWLPVIDFNTKTFSALVCREDIENLPSVFNRKFTYRKVV